MSGMGAEAMKLLLVEDDEQQHESWSDTASRLSSENGKTAIELVCSRSPAEAKKQLNGSFDGVIIDWAFDSGLGSENGGAVIREMSTSLRRIPFVIYAAKQPDDSSIGDNHACIGIYLKANEGSEIEEILNEFRDTYDTGLTRIIGGKGEIEQNLLAVFSNSIMRQRKAWIAHNKKAGGNVEKSLLRHTLNHLVHLIDQNQAPYYPEEAYIFPMDPEEIMTGRVFGENSSSERIVVLSPACDLVPRRDGNMKTDRILLVSIESAKDVEKDRNSGDLKKLRSNNFSGYYHFLPNSGVFGGGYINFRRLISVSKSELDENYHMESIQISHPFIKDIISRFSSYYARQGQPEIQD